MIQVYEIDENSFYTGNSYFVEDEPKENEIVKPYEKGFVKPKWDGEEWIEGATQEEIDEINKIDICEPTDKERLEQVEEMVGILAEQVAKQSLGM